MDEENEIDREQAEVEYGDMLRKMEQDERAEKERQKSETKEEVKKP